MLGVSISLFEHTKVDLFMHIRKVNVISNDSQAEIITDAKASIPTHTKKKLLIIIDKHWQ